MLTVVDICKLFLLAKPYIDSIWFFNIAGINLLQTTTTLVGMTCLLLSFLYSGSTRIPPLVTAAVFAKLAITSIGLFNAISYQHAIGYFIKEIIALSFLIMGLRLTKNREVACYEFLRKYSYVIVYALVTMLFESQLQDIFGIKSQNIYITGEGEEYYRATGTYPDQGTVVQYLVISLPFLVVYLKRKLTNLALLVSGVFLAFLLSERTFFVAILVTAFMFLARRISIEKIIGILFIPIPFFIFSEKLTQLSRQFLGLWDILQSGPVTIDDVTGFASGRVGIWYDMYKVFVSNFSIENLLFGFGIDSARYYVGLERGLSPSEIYIPESTSQALTAHSDLLRIFFEFGLIGTIVNVAIFSLIWMMIKNGADRKIALVLKIIFSIILIRSITGHEQYHISSFYTFLFLVGANYSKNGTKETPELSKHTSTETEESNVSLPPIPDNQIARR